MLKHERGAKMAVFGASELCEREYHAGRNCLVLFCLPTVRYSLKVNEKKRTKKHRFCTKNLKRLKLALVIREHVATYTTRVARARDAYEKKKPPR